MLSRRTRYALNEDALLTQILALSDLTFEDRLNWIACIRAKMIKLSADIGPEPSGRWFQTVARDAARAMIQSRVEWLDRLHEAVLADWSTRSHGKV